jgi:two-component system response regulator DctR
MTAEFVHIVDDDAAVRDALHWLLTSVGLEVRCYGSAEVFLESGGKTASGVLVLDIRMEGMSGLELFGGLKAAGTALPIIFLTGHGDVPLAVDAIKSGAFDFLEKPFDDAEFVKIVERALVAGRKLRIMAEQSGEIARRLQSLSARELQVMELLITGRANKVIAAELNIAMRTVEVHRARILAKLGVKTAVELSAVLSAAKGRG